MDILLITRFCIELPEAYKNSVDYSNTTKIVQQLYLLEHITLLYILLQNNKNFKWIILTDKRIPQKVNQRLNDISNKYGNIRIKYHNKGDYDISKLMYYKDFLDDRNKYAITIRLDEDDAIIYNYIDMIEKISIQSLKKMDLGAICFHNGIYMKIKNGEKHMKHSYMKSHSVGLALFINKRTCSDELVSIYFTPHNEIYKNLKKYSNVNNKKSYFYQYNTVEPYYIKTCHNNNDSDYRRIDYYDIKYERYLKYFGWMT